MAEILIIDDDEGMRYTLSVLVRKLGHNPFSASYQDTRVPHGKEEIQIPGGLEPGRHYW